jgi:pantoate--beta-alanine ligase
MKIIKTANKITLELLNKKKIGFIPTMGCLHDGHVSLIKKSKKKKLLTIVSIFVNPFQFNNKKDYKKYPKTILTDLKICKKNKVDYVYLPQEKDIYPEKKKSSFKIKFIILKNLWKENLDLDILKVLLKLLKDY